MKMARTLYDKLRDEHDVYQEEDVTAILFYIDRHLVHDGQQPASV